MYVTIFGQGSGRLLRCMAAVYLAPLHLLLPPCLPRPGWLIHAHQPFVLWCWLGFVWEQASLSLRLVPPVAWPWSWLLPQPQPELPLAQVSRARHWDAWKMLSCPEGWLQQVLLAQVCPSVLHNRKPASSGGQAGSAKGCTGDKIPHQPLPSQPTAALKTWTCVRSDFSYRPPLWSFALSSTESYCKIPLLCGAGACSVNRGSCTGAFASGWAVPWARGRPSAGLGAGGSSGSTPSLDAGECSKSTMDETVSIAASGCKRFISLARCCSCGLNDAACCAALTI